MNWPSFFAGVIVGGGVVFISGLLYMAYSFSDSM